NAPPAVLNSQVVRPLRHPAGAREGFAPASDRQALLLGDGDRQLLAPLAAAATEHLATSRGLHAFAETVCPLAALAMGLKRPLHGILRKALRARQTRTERS